MHLKLRDQQLNTIMYIYSLLYQDLMLTTNQKSTINIHTKKETNTIGSHQITREENKRGKEKQVLPKQIQNN